MEDQEYLVDACPHKGCNEEATMIVIMHPDDPSFAYDANSDQNLAFYDWNYSCPEHLPLLIDELKQELVDKEIAGWLYVAEISSVISYEPAKTTQQSLPSKQSSKQKTAATSTTSKTITARVKEKPEGLDLRTKEGREWKQARQNQERA